MKIEQWMIDDARKAGACHEGLERYKAGDDISVLRFADAVWIEDNCPKIIAVTGELWCRCKNGYGDGYGDGYGYGYGYGDGYGDGYEDFYKKYNQEV